MQFMYYLKLRILLWHNPRVNSVINMYGEIYKVGGLTGFVCIQTTSDMAS